MTEEERRILDAAAECRALVTELIERAFLASQRLCKEIQEGSPKAMETAQDVERRVGSIFEWWNRLTGTQRNLSS